CRHRCRPCARPGNGVRCAGAGTFPGNVARRCYTPHQRIWWEGTVLLAVDIGNTNIVAGVFEGDRLAMSWRLATDRRKTTDEYAAALRSLLDHRGVGLRDVKGVSISSTVPPLTATFRRLSETYFDLPP